MHDESGRRASRVQLYGVDERFWKFHGREIAGGAPGEREILVSPALARELQCTPQESLLVRVEKPAAIPTESLHGRKEDVGRTFRLTLRDVLPAPAMGEFSIRLQQGDVRAAFVSLKRLQTDLEQPGKANTILISESGTGSATAGALEAALSESFRLEDLGVKLRALDAQRCLVVESDTGLIRDSLVDKARAAAAETGLATSAIFTYLANSIRAGDREIPYSLVTAFDDESLARLDPGAISNPSPIVLNDWAAGDLGVAEGSRIELDYYVWLEQGRLATRTAEFQLSGIVPIAGAAADRDLAPDYPGITESDGFADWNRPSHWT